MDDSTRIAGYKTIKDWKNIREKIRKSSDDKNWEEAFNFYMERLETRYFKPIKDIKNNDNFNGEGFSIMAILCSLVEFLETTWTGEVYRFCNSKHLKKFEYNQSKKKFLSFLENRPPFNSVFTKKSKLASEFYSDVRCGLLHEASTKGVWAIRVDNKSDVCELRDGQKIIDRELFEECINEYLEYYKEQLFKSKDLKSAFIRKINHIAGLPLNH